MNFDFDSMPAKTRHRWSVAASTLASIVAICAVILPVVGVIASPFVVTYLTDAMGDEIRGEVQEQVTPVNAGMKVLIENNIAELEDEISALEYRQRETDFSALDAQNLTTKRRRLRAQQDALLAIIEAERSRQK